MNKLQKIKYIGMALLMVNFAVGCASAPEEKPAEPEQKKPEPAAESKPAEPMVDTSDSSYQVVKGDNLWNISGKSSVYGNPYQWPLIYKANSDKIKDADLIYPGQTFTISANPSDAEAAAAIQHAKTRGSWSIGVVEDSDKAYLAQ